MMKKFIYTIIISGLLFGIGAGSTAAGLFKKDTPRNNNVLSVQTSQQPTSQEKQILVNEPERTIPKRVKIPKIGVDTIIEAVGNDAKGNMDVPKDDDNTSWYEPGFRPGQKGNAVLAGHLDKKDASPAVFWDIDKLEVGDTIIITDENGKELTFAITHTEKFPNEGFPINRVFGDSSDAMLNLITCHGEWDSGSGYDERYVVFSKLVE